MAMSTFFLFLFFCFERPRLALCSVVVPGEIQGIFARAGEEGSARQRRGKPSPVRMKDAQEAAPKTAKPKKTNTTIVQCVPALCAARETCT